MDRLPIRITAKTTGGGAIKNNGVMGSFLKIERSNIRRRQHIPGSEGIALLWK